MTQEKITPNVILQAVDIVVNKRIEELELDKTIIATIDQPITPDRDGSYRVQYAGGYFTAYAAKGAVYSPHTSVYVQVPQNNFSNKKIILGSTSSYYSENDIEAVSSAMSNYMPVGKNALEKILVILTVFYIFVVDTEAVPPSLKLGIPYLQTEYHL